MILRLLTEIARGVHTVLSNQEKQMATLADMQTSMTNLKTEFDAAVQRLQNAPPSVLQTDLDPLKAEMDQMTAQMAALLNPPAPAA